MAFPSPCRATAGRPAGASAWRSSARPATWARDSCGSSTTTPTSRSSGSQPRPQPEPVGARAGPPRRHGLRDRRRRPGQRGRLPRPPLRGRGVVQASPRVGGRCVGPWAGLPAARRGRLPHMGAGSSIPTRGLLAGAVYGLPELHRDELRARVGAGRDRRGAQVLPDRHDPRAGAARAGRAHRRRRRGRRRRLGGRPRAEGGADVRRGEQEGDERRTASAATGTWRRWSR